MTTPKTPWEYLRTCSRTGLEEYQLVQLNIVAKQRKIIEAEVERLVEAASNAEIARLIRDNAEELARIGAAQGVFKFEETWDVLPDTARERIPARRGRPAQRYRTRDVA